MVKPETEVGINAFFFLALTSLGGASIWQGQYVWAGFSFGFALITLGLMFSAAGEVEVDDENGEPPVGE